MYADLKKMKFIESSHKFFLISDKNQAPNAASTVEGVAPLCSFRQNHPEILMKKLN